MNARLATAISLTIGSVIVMAVAWALRPAPTPPSPDVASVSQNGTTETARSGPATPEPSATAPNPAPATPAFDEMRQAPRFDVVRVEPDGSAVIAGRAEPGATVTLNVDGKPVGQVAADANGQFVMTPPPLAAGERALSLSSSVKGAVAVKSAQTVTILGAAQDKRVVALAEPGASTRILSDAAPAPAERLTIRAVEAEQGGAFYASGLASARAAVRLYLNGGLVAETNAGQDGAWSIRIEKGMKAGDYQVRADEIGAAGKVASRAEVTFNYPASPELASPRRAAASPAPSAPAQAPAASETAAAGQARPAGTTVEQVRTHQVARGDSLWRMSAKLYGSGFRYTEIYAANAQQIRNPDLIYPGQILVAPEKR